MISRKLQALLLIGLLIPVAYAIDFGVQSISGRYVPVKLTIQPATVNIGNVTEGETISYNITITNNSNFDLNSTYAIGTPAFIVAGIQGWTSGTYRIVKAKATGTVKVTISVGRPALADIPVDFNFTIQFFGTRVK